MQVIQLMQRLNFTRTDVSVKGSNVSSYLTMQPLTKEKSDARIIIGANTSSADGILVLESST